MNKLIKTITIVATLLSSVSAFAEHDQKTETIFTNLMAATISNNYNDFITDCDAGMKAAITKPMIEGVSRQIEPHAKQGYDAQYLGELNQKGYQVYLWKLKFKDGSNDILATLSIKDGKVGGFYLH